MKDPTPRSVSMLLAGALLYGLALAIVVAFALGR